MAYIYSLRYALALNRDNTKRLKELAKFCHDAKIDDINFFINHEEIGRGHLLNNETEEWLSLAREMKDFSIEHDLTFSLNPGITLMHGDRGRKLNTKLAFGTMVDANGVQASAVACPLDPIFQDYLADTYGMYATLEPNYLWIEDDLRHFNHKPIQWGCFCEKHMDTYRQILNNQTLTREELVSKILQSGQASNERKVYLDCARQTIIDIVKKIQIKVHSISPKTKLALMTSQPDQHTTEGRDWQKLFTSLSGKQPFVARPHLPAYNEVTAKEYSKDFNRVSRVTADLLGDDAELFPELENYMYSRYTKSNHFSQFQLVTSLMLHPKGTTMNLFDMMGTGVVNDYHIQEMLATVKPYLNDISQLDLKVSEQVGIRVLYSPNTAYQVETSIGEERDELISQEYSWLELLSSFGFSVKPSRYDPKISQEIIAISGQFLRTLTNQQICQLFEENFTLIDGETVAILVERELGYLIGVTDCSWKAVRSGQQSYEQVTNHKNYYGVSEARMSLMQQTGDFLDITYESDESSIISRAYNEYDQDEGSVCAVSKNSFILPISWDKKAGWSSQYISFKEEIIRDVLLHQSINTKTLALTIDMPYVNLIHYQKNQKNYYLVANFSTESYETIRCQLVNETACYDEYSLTGKQTVTYQDNYLQTSLASLEMKVFVEK